MNQVSLTGNDLTIDSLFQIVNEEFSIGLSDATIQKVNKCRQVIEEILKSKRVVYGVNTGFGKFSEITIADDKIDDLQKNLVMSHATGVGEPLPADIVKLVYILKINSLAKGLSGIRLNVLQTLINMYHAAILPIIPSKGSVGASGDLAPLAHFSLVLLGMGEATLRGSNMPGSEAMNKAGIQPITLKAKEGLALLNGLQVSTAIACFAQRRIENLARIADVIGAMTLEGLKGTPTAFDDRIQKARGFQGQIEVGKILSTLLQNSEIRFSHKECRKVQDAYSLRCMPQVHGTVRETLRFTRSILETEINSCTDNPLIFMTGPLAATPAPAQFLSRR